MRLACSFLTSISIRGTKRIVAQESMDSSFTSNLQTSSMPFFDRFAHRSFFVLILLFFIPFPIENFSSLFLFLLFSFWIEIEGKSLPNPNSLPSNQISTNQTTISNESNQIKANQEPATEPNPPLPEDCMSIPIFSSSSLLRLQHHSPRITDQSLFFSAPPGPLYQAALLHKTSTHYSIWRSCDFPQSTIWSLSPSSLSTALSATQPTFSISCIFPPFLLYFLVSLSSFRKYSSFSLSFSQVLFIELSTACSLWRPPYPYSSRQVQIESFLLYRLEVYFIPSAIFSWPSRSISFLFSCSLGRSADSFDSLLFYSVSFCFFPPLNRIYDEDLISLLLACHQHDIVSLYCSLPFSRANTWNIWTFYRIVLVIRYEYSSLLSFNLIEIYVSEQTLSTKNKILFFRHSIIITLYSFFTLSSSAFFFVLSATWSNLYELLLWISSLAFFLSFTFSLHDSESIGIVLLPLWNSF